ncbi:patatin-like phospholipase family protein [Glaciecola sp. 1036]|uniref:patatin-like phospholipase family protein n=1 Tax=Alteromonadaceae TaxID=72275 RepID=UPI003D01F234
MDSENQAIPISSYTSLINGDVGICMSGGGYRAAAFHFGCLDYLNSFGLTEKLNAISTVSGGTFTGARYALSRAEDKSFDEFFKAFYKSLNNTNLVADGLERLAHKENKVSSNRQDLIVSMAQVYANTFFCKEDKSPYYFGDILNADNAGALKNVVLNTTDFRSGLAFRFQRTETFDGKIGNFYNNISKEDAAQIRLSDIVAASSCFPGGFEPISFPYDFTWQNEEIPATVTSSFPFKRDYSDPTAPKGPIGLMDGGVFDNQGLQSLLTIEEKNPDDFDVLIISDVDQPSLTLYQMPLPEDAGGLSLNTISRMAKAFVVLCGITLITILYHAVQDWQTDQWSWERFVFLYSIPFILTTVASTAVYFIYTIIRDDVLPKIPSVGERAWDSLKKLKFGQIRAMINLRFGSLMTLTTSVFMKRIRSLVYGLAYNTHDSLSKNKRISNLIYTLSPSKTISPPFPAVEKPSTELNKVACVAFNMGTTLWFDKEYELPCLVAAGQASLCYNLLKLMARRLGQDPQLYSPECKAEYDKLLSDWQSFNKDPFFALKQHQVKEDWLAIHEAVKKMECEWGMFEHRTASLQDVELT